MGLVQWLIVFCVVSVVVVKLLVVSMIESVLFLVVVFCWFVGCCNCRYVCGMSIRLLNVALLVLCQDSLNCLACRVLACPRILVLVKLKVCPCSSAWLAGRDSGSWRLIALRCSCIRVSTFFEVSPMYCFGQSLQKNVYMALRRCVSGVLSLCLLKVVRSLLVGLCAMSILCCLSNLAVISETVLMYGRAILSLFVSLLSLEFCVFCWVGRFVNLLINLTG